MAQRFLAPSVTFEGIISQNGTINNDSHLITRAWAKGNVVNGIHSDSANYAEVVSEGGSNKLKLKPLVVTSVTVNSAQADLAAFISNVYSGSNFQEGDIVFLTTPSPTEAYIHNGGTAGTAADFDQLNQGLSDAQIRSKFSGSAGINYDSSTGAITADQGEIRAFFSGSAGVNYDSSTGAITADQTEIRGMLSAGGLLSYSGGQFSLQNSDVRGAVSVDGSGLLSYNSGTGVFDLTTAQVRAQVSASGLLTYSGGAFGLTAATVRGQISEASGSLCHYDPSTGEIEMTDADVRGALSAGGLLSYSGGQFSIDTATVRAQVSASGLLTYSGGAFGLTAASVRNQISEASGSLCHYNQSTGEIEMTNADVRGALAASGESDEMLDYVSGTGSFSLNESKLRKEFNNQSLSANVGLALTHNLNKKLVHVSAMDSSGNKVDLEIVYTSTTVATVKSTVALSGVEIAISI